MTWVRDVPRQPLQLDEDQPDEERVDAEEQDFHLRRRLLSSARAARPQLALLQRAQLIGGRAPRASIDSSSSRRWRTSSLQQLALAVLLGHLVVVVVVLVGAVGDAVADGLGVGPEPGERPEQAAEHERQQAQGGDRRRVCGWWRLCAIFSGSTWTIQNSTMTTTGTTNSTTSARMSATVSSASPDRNDGPGGRGGERDRARGEQLLQHCLGRTGVHIRLV